MTTLSCHRVKFTDINEEVEVQKTKRRAEKLRLKQQKKEAKKMAVQERTEDLRHFLFFLQSTRDLNQLRRETSGSDVAIARVTLMFPQIRNNNKNNNQAERLTAFCRVVSSLQLPRGTKRQHENQSAKLHDIMELWVEDGLYDRELDPFLQFLRVSIGQGTLADLPVRLVDDANAEQARQMARHLEEQGIIGRFPARQLPEEAKVHLRELKHQMTGRAAYAFAGSAVRTASSGESSDSEVEEGFNFDTSFNVMQPS